MTALRTFIDRITGPDVRAVSVDVFDTLLLRTTTPEIVKFRRIGARQAEAMRPAADPPPDASEMLHLRLLAAETAYRHTRLVDGAREPSVDVIHEIMVGHLLLAHRIDPEQRTELLRHFLEIELQEESADLTANRRLVPALLAARSRGLPVVAISDMYLRRDHVRRLIDGAGAGDAVSDVYVSSEYGVSKASGALFDHVCEFLHIRPEELVHVGDNRHADFRMARARGVQAFHTPRPLHWRGRRELRHRTFLRRMRTVR